MQELIQGEGVWEASQPPPYNSTTKHFSFIKGGIGPFTTEIRTHICSCHNFFPPFFCADTFIASLFLIVCASRLYVKCLYRHFFLEDT